MKYKKRVGFLAGPFSCHSSLFTLFYLLFTIYLNQTILLNNFSISLKLQRIQVGRPWGQFEGWSHVSS